VVVDDGSNDDTPGVLARWQAREPRLVVERTGPRGLPAALETARARARGAFLARHDGDDLSHRDRLAAQLAAFAADPQLTVVGSRVRLFPSARVGTGMRRWWTWHDALLDHEAMEREAWIDSPLCHGTAMLRADAVAALGGWRERGVNSATTATSARAAATPAMRLLLTPEQSTTASRGGRSRSTSPCARGRSGSTAGSCRRRCCRPGRSARRCRCRCR